MKKKCDNRKMADLTVKELAAKYKVNRRVANGWCERGLFPNAKIVETPMISYWAVPEFDLIGFVPQKRKGRPSAIHPSKATLAKRASRANSKPTLED